MDLLNEGWLDSDEIWENISELYKIYSDKLNTKIKFTAEVAVIIDERSPIYLAYSYSPLYAGLMTQLYRIGSPVKFHLLSDVIDSTVKLPKANIFLGT